MKKLVTYFILLGLFSMLVGVRAYEEALFYDPFIHYFQNDYLYAKMPTYDLGKLLLHLFYRFGMNTCISLTIIYFFFKKWGYVILSAKLYALAFILLVPLYLYLLSSDFSNGYLFPFYIRRLLVHPIFLLLLLVAWYYEQQLESAM